MPTRGDQVGDVTGCPATTVEDDRLHVLRMAGKNFDGNARHDLPVSLQQLHLTAGDQRIIVVLHVADGVALTGVAGVLPFALLHVILRLGKRGHSLPALPDRVPSTVIEVQVRVDDNVDVFGRNADGGQVVE